MSLRILIIPDKFKGTLTAHQAADAIAAGWRRARPTDRIEQLPMSDGGDGFGPILAGLLGASVQRTQAVDAAGRPVEVEWGWLESERLAILEAARVNGLAQLPRGEFPVTSLDTRGVGMVLEAIAGYHPARCIIGIGGSATNDGGFGLATHLGWRFRDAAGKPILSWWDLANLEQIQPPKQALNLGQLQVAVDVQNPLLGERGCSRIYGPQKGLRPEDFERAEAGLGRLAMRLREQHGLDLAERPGAGAAGGLGFGLAAFLGADLTPGFALFASLAGVSGKIGSSDLVITGEGCIDGSSLMGKGVGGVTELCRLHRRPCIGLAGTLESRASLESQFRIVAGLVPDRVSREAALANAALHLEQLAYDTAAQFIP